MSKTPSWPRYWYLPKIVHRYVIPQPWHEAVAQQIPVRVNCFTIAIRSCESQCCPLLRVLGDQGNFRTQTWHKAKLTLVGGPTSGSDGSNGGGMARNRTRAGRSHIGVCIITCTAPLCTSWSPAVTGSHLIPLVSDSDYASPGPQTLCVAAAHEHRAPAQARAYELVRAYRGQPHALRARDAIVAAHRRRAPREPAACPHRLRLRSHAAERGAPYADPEGLQAS